MAGLSFYDSSTSIYLAYFDDDSRELKYGAFKNKKWNEHNYHWHGGGYPSLSSITLKRAYKTENTLESFVSVIHNNYGGDAFIYKEKYQDTGSQPFEEIYKTPENEKVNALSFDISKGVNYKFYLAYIYNNNKIKVVTANKNDTSNFRTLGNIDVGYPRSITIIVDDDSIPHIAYTDGFNDYKVTVMKYSNNEWQIIGRKDISTGKVSDINLAIDNGDIYLAYRDEKDMPVVMKYIRN